jgi:competence protein ComEA
MRNLLTNYFYYSRGERNGVIVLATLSLLIVFMPSLFSFWHSKTNVVTDFSVFEKDIAAFNSAMPSEAKNTEGGISFNEKNIELFNFDPNTTSAEDFMRLGLSPKVATIITHYREKGGRFFRKEDLKKIYGLKPDDYERLEDYITLNNVPKSSLTSFNYPSQNERYGNQYEKFKDKNEPPIDIKVFPFDPNIATEMELRTLGIDKNVVKNIIKFREKNGKFYKKEDLKRIYSFSEIDYLRLEKYINITDNQQFINYNNSPSNLTETKKFKTENVNLTIDVNKANINEWLELRGIGSTFAARIVEQREKLGGFTSIEQIKIIHGLPDSTYRKIQPHLLISTPIFRKISINKITIDNFMHPYLTRKQVEILMRYRVNHGDFKKIEDLKKTGVLDDNIIEKLKPYIVFE